MKNPGEMVDLDLDTEIIPLINKSIDIIYN